MIFDKWIFERLKLDRDNGRLISAVKAISWRIVGTIDTWIISYLITGKWNLAFSIATVEVFTKVLLYYFHERLWLKVRVRISNKTS